MHGTLLLSHPDPANFMDPVYHSMKENGSKISNFFHGPLKELRDSPNGLPRARIIPG